MDVVKILVALAILIPCALYGISAMRRERDQPEPEPQAQPEQEQGQEQEAPPFEPNPATVTAEQTFTKKVTNVALTWVKQSITGGSDTDRPAIEPPRPKPAPADDGPQWAPPTDLDGLPDLSEYDVEIAVERPAPNPLPPPDSPPAAEALVIERGVIDRVRDWLGGSGDATLAPPPGPGRAPVLGQVDPDVLDTIPDPRQLPEPELLAIPVLGVPAGSVSVEQIPAAPVATQVAAPADQIALPAADSSPAATGEVIEPVEVIAPVELQGVDDMDLVPAGRRTMAQVPTVAGIRTALRTLGFRIFRNWLLSFRKANLTDLGNAQHMHRLAVMQAQRCRVKLAVATNMLLAAQADGLGPNVIRRCQEAWLQAHREVSYAYQAAAATDALVRVSGGVPVSLKAAIDALDRDHGQMAAAARRMAVEPVRDMSFYRN
ncbi:hypothetical protein AB0392_32280 [Nonomuraea angiospora]|uniref:hypothetical protein n=1 Tax=Nonomuraea angiospora TaxID=46172 RepID=UPI00344B4D48